MGAVTNRHGVNIIFSVQIVGLFVLCISYRKKNCNFGCYKFRIVFSKLFLTIYWSIILFHPEWGLACSGLRESHFFSFDTQSLHGKTSQINTIQYTIQYNIFIQH